MSDNDFQYNFTTPATPEVTVEEVVPAVEPIVEEVVPVVEETPSVGSYVMVDIPVETPAEKDEIVVYAMRDLSMPGATKLTKGYNVLTKNQYSKWKKSPAVRVATEEEIKTYVK